MNFDVIKKDIIQAYEEGCFFKKIIQVYLEEIRSPLKKLPALLADLHNEMLININEAYQNLTVEDHKYDVFILSELYSKTLPMMSCSIADVFTVAEKLNVNGKAIIDIHDGIYNFCQHEFIRSKQGLDLIKENTKKLSAYISSVIIPASVHDPLWCLIEIKKLILEGDNVIRSQAYWSLGNIKITNEKDIKIAIELLSLASVSENDNIANVNIFRSSINLGKNNEKHWGCVKGILRNLLDKESKDVVVIATQTSHWEYNNIPYDILIMLLDSVKKADLNEDAYNCIGFIMISLAKDNECDFSIKFLEEILERNENINITKFQSFIQYMINDNNSLLYKLVTKWLLSGNPRFCRDILNILNSVHDKGIELTVDKKIIVDLSDHLKVFLSKKAIGWLMTRPIDVFCFIYSIYEKGSSELQCYLEGFLFDPLLINYPSDLGDYLKARKEREDNSVFISLVNSLEARMKSYLKGFSEAYNIKELNTPYANKVLYWKMADKLMQKARGNGPKSIFEDMVSVQHLIYGNSSIYYVYNSPNGKPQRTEAPMHTFSYSSEMPNMDVIDPIGLNYCLLKFRTEMPENETNN